MIRRYSRFANRKAFYDYREDPNIPEEFFEDETMGNPDITNPLDTGDFTKFSDNELYDFIIDYIKDLASVLEQGKPMPVNDMFDDLWDEAESRPNLDIDSLAETCDVIIEKAEEKGNAKTQKTLDFIKDPYHNRFSSRRSNRYGRRIGRYARKNFRAALQAYYMCSLEGRPAQILTDQFAHREIEGSEICEKLKKFERHSESFPENISDETIIFEDDDFFVTLDKFSGSIDLYSKQPR